MAKARDAEESVQLTFGPSVVRLAGIVVLSVLGTLFALFMAAFSAFVASRGDYFTSLLFALVPVSVVLLIVQTALRARSSIFWLEGTVLVQSRFRRNLRFDLMLSAIGTDSVTGSWGIGSQVPRLIVAEPGSKSMVLPLRDRYRGDALLAPAHLRMLADIVGRRNDIEHANDIARTMRELASDPFDLRS